MAMFAIYFTLYVIIWLEKLLFPLIILHEHFKVNICLSFTCLVSSGLICYWNWTNLFCLFLIVKCRQWYLQDEAKKISCKGVAVHQWQATVFVKCFVWKRSKFQGKKLWTQLDAHLKYSRELIVLGLVPRLKHSPIVNAVTAWRYKKNQGLSQCSCRIFLSARIFIKR